MVGVTDMPGRSRFASGLPASRTIFTGMRWTTLVKLPVALSGGRRANSWPLAGAMLSTRPVERAAGERVDGDLDLLAGTNVRQLGFLVVCDDVGGRDRNHRHQFGARLNVLADPQGPRADDAVHGRDDGRCRTG